MTNEQEKQTSIKGKLQESCTELPKLKAKQRKVLDAILVSRTQKEAAELAGVHPSTITRYHQDPLFAEHLREALQEKTSLAAVQLQSGVLNKALVTLGQVQDYSKNDIARVMAANSILDQFRYITDLADKKEQQALKLENLRLQNERLRLQNEVLAEIGAASTEDKLAEYFNVLRQNFIETEKD
jgi:hypothetical protein